MRRIAVRFVPSPVKPTVKRITRKEECLLGEDRQLHFSSAVLIVVHQWDDIVRRDRCLRRRNAAVDHLFQFWVVIATSEFMWAIAFDCTLECIPTFEAVVCICVPIPSRITIVGVW